VVFLFRFYILKSFTTGFGAIKIEASNSEVYVPKVPTANELS